MDRKLVYEKQNGTRDIEKELPKSPQVPHESIEQTTEPQMHIPSAYRKEDGVLSYSLICVISGGTDRECVFLNELVKKRTFKSVDVIFVSTKNGGGGLTPRMMQSAYQAICKDGLIEACGRTVKLDSVDTIYMLTDVDHYEKEMKDILANEESHTPVWIISNPDFEIWLYYCYRNNPYEELKAVIDEKPSQRSSKLKTVNGTFNNGVVLTREKPLTIWQKALPIPRNTTKRRKVYLTYSPRGCIYLQKTCCYAWEKNMRSSCERKGSWWK